MVEAPPVAPALMSAEAPPPDPAPSPPTPPSLSVFLEAAGWLGASGASVGLFIGLLAWRVPLAGYLAANRLSPLARRGLLFFMAAGLALAVLPAIVLWLRRGREGLERARQWAAFLSPAVITGLLPSLLDTEGWRTSPEGPLTAAVSITLVSALAVATVSRALAQPPLLPERLRRGLTGARPFLLARPWLATVAAGAATIFYGAWFSTFTLNNHATFHTSGFDLGIEDNLLWNLAFRDQPLFYNTPAGGSMTAAAHHQAWFSYALVWVYRFFPDARFLLVFQSVALALGTVPLFLYARLKLGPWLAALVTWLYVLYPPLGGANLYDFHYQPLSIPSLLAFAYCMEKGRTRWAWFFVVLTLSFREDLGLLLSAVAAWLAVTGRKPGTALGVIAVGLTHFVVLKLVVMARLLGGAESFINQYSGLLPEGDSGFGGVLKTVAANPAYTVSWLLEPGKGLYLLQVLGPLLFLPVLRRANLVLLLPGFFFTLLSTRYPALIMISFQYSAYWVPFVFLAAVSSLEHLKALRPHLVTAAASGLLLATALQNRQFGAVLKVDHVHGSFHTDMRLRPTAADRVRLADFSALLAQLPPGEPVAAAELLVPHVTAREHAYTLRVGLYDATWLLATTPARGDELPLLRAALGPGGDFGVVDLRGQFVLARKGHPRDRNAEAQRLLGY